MARITHHENLWNLQGAGIGYQLALLPGGIAAHLYAGAPLQDVNIDNVLRRSGIPSAADFSVQECTLGRLPQEYPSFGLGDLREGALTAIAPDGTSAVDLRYVSAEVLPGKPALEGLPATFGENCQTLKLTLKDDVTGLTAELLYTVFDDCPAVARSARLVNGGDAPLTLTRAMSFCLDLPDADYDLITLSGAWARERSVVRRRLAPGEQGVSTRSGASSAHASPFLALARAEVTERQGDVMGLALIYSGNFTATTSVHQHGTARALIGINDRDFRWILEPGEAFQCPEAVLVFSREGLGGMSRAFHALWTNHLLPPRWVHKRRPVLLNSWEAAYFDFDEEKLVSIAKAAREAGAELFVMDDGWFGHRDDDYSSLGDWTCDERKLPGGLGRLGDRVRALGLQFGIWMEPEMISRDSDLYRAHPEWAIAIAGRAPIESRHQLTLDMGRRDVQDFVIESVSRTLRDSGAAYLKWDMNRYFSNIGTAALPPERQGELPHRYILGLYRVLDALVKAFPDVLFEGCASGGGRYDAGMLYYTPQFWCSDNTDALSRLKIQAGTTLMFPPSTVGSHVSAVPNHQTARVTPLSTRFAVAMAGQFGYELDPRKLTEEEREALPWQIKKCIATWDVRMNGALYRLTDPFVDNDAAWLSVTADKSEALLTVVRASALPNTLPTLYRLDGLDRNRRYVVEETGERFTGAELEDLGLYCELPMGDAASVMLTLKACE